MKLMKDTGINISKIIRSARKSISIEINKNAEVIVRANHKTPDKLIFSFIEEKKDWIIEKRIQMQSRLEQVVPKTYEDGSSIMIFGEMYTIKFLNFNYGYHIDHDVKVLEIHEKYKINIKDYLHFIIHSHAQFYLKKKTLELAKHIGLKVNKVRISKAATRWGSCSSRKNINLSWKLIMAPEKVSIYVILHELAHLVHHDHSPRFWALVAKWDPDYKKHRKWLRVNGHLLNI